MKKSKISKCMAAASLVLSIIGVCCGYIADAIPFLALACLWWYASLLESSSDFWHEECKKQAKKIDELQNAMMQLREAYNQVYTDNMRLNDELMDKK